MDNKAIKKLESDLWESADLLRAGSNLTSQQYCMPVLGLLFLRYAYSRFKKVEEEILKNRPVRNGRVMPVEASDFAEKSALYLPKEAQYSYLVNLPEDIKAANVVSENGLPMNSLGEVVNHAMELVEEQSEQLTGVLPKDYTIFSDELLERLETPTTCGSLISMPTLMRQEEQALLWLLRQQTARERIRISENSWSRPVMWML